MEFATTEAAFYMTAILMFISGAVVSSWMEGTPPDFGTHELPAPVPEPDSASHCRVAPDMGRLGMVLVVQSLPRGPESDPVGSSTPRR